MKAELTESYMVEKAAIDWLKQEGYQYEDGSNLSPENGERESYRSVILQRRFLNAIKRLNPWLIDSQAEEVYNKIKDIDHPDFLIKSKIFYETLTNGIKIVIKQNGREIVKRVKIIEFENHEINDFLVANQFSVEYQYQNNMYRRPDLVIFINGIPVAIFEFKNFNANETAKDAFYDHVVKKEDIPQLYIYAQILVASDGLETKYGSITSNWDRFFIWEGIFDDNDLEATEIEEERYYYKLKHDKKQMTSLEVMIKGLFRKVHLLEYIEDFVFYEKVGESYEKRIAMFHQFYVVRKAVRRTIQTVKEGKKTKERRIGVVWHTQGTGKSLTMLFYARKILKIKELENPLLLFITDRKNLDEQLYKIFTALPIAEQARSINHLKEMLKTKSGGIIFATIQKFGKKRTEEFPLLTERENIIVIADEAHRSQYKELALNLRRAIPNASFMGFTATPIELEERSTTLVFGKPLSIYSMEKAKRHKVIVPIYYEARLARLHLTNEFIDEEFEEISETVVKDPETKESLKKRFARIEKLILADDRMEQIAKDIVTHYNKRVKELEGKAIIVTISRKAAVKLYEKIIRQPNAPSIVVVMSGNKQRDPKEFWSHIRSEYEMKELENNFKNPDSDPKMAIVVDMWLTGFDVPCLHTMYFDKPMKDHSLVQAIARVNRVFKDKPGGLIVDYIGIADNLRKSLSMYTLESIRQIFVDINEVLNLLKEKYDIVSSLFYGINFKEWTRLESTELAKLTTIAYDMISKDEEKKKTFIKNFVALKKLYALACPHNEAYSIKDDIRFFEMIKKMMVKYSFSTMKEITRDLEYEISQLISKSITAEKPIDVFSLMGKERPEISIFDEKFLAQFREMEYKNYAAELLLKIINDELTVRMKRNPYRYESLHEMMKRLIDKYNIKLIDTADVIEELIKIAYEIKRANEEGKKLNLTEEELSFYDLLISEKKYFENIKEIEQVAREVVKELGYYIKVADWNRKDYIKAKIKAAVKNVLIKIIDGRVSYKEIDNLSYKILSHAVLIFATI